MLFTIGRNPLAATAWVIFGAAFAGSGWFLTAEAGHPFMGAIFAVVGALGMLGVVPAREFTRRPTERHGTENGRRLITASRFPGERPSSAAAHN